MIGMIGITVSYQSGRVNWRTVVSEGIKIAFIRATEGVRFTDPYFHENYAAADDAGLMVVPYHFINVEPSTQQIENFRSVARFGMMEAVMLQLGGIDRLGREMAEGLRQTVMRRALLCHSRVLLRWTEKYPWYFPSNRRPVGPWLFWGDTSLSEVKGIFRRVETVHFNGTEEELANWFEHGTIPELDPADVGL